MVDYLYDSEIIDVTSKQIFESTDKTNNDFSDKTAMKRFDLLDFVIIDVPATNLPWQERSNQVTQLFKQCKFTQKPMLALGCGMSQLSFYCAMEGKKLSVINGREMGGSLETIKGAVEP